MGDGEGGRRVTLQKSIDFTPLLPNAGPTGGLGLACPAPTISFTIWSVACFVRDIVDAVVEVGISDDFLDIEFENLKMPEE